VKNALHATVLSRSSEENPSFQPNFTFYTMPTALKTECVIRIVICVLRSE
jgi:hypothetical protein